MNEIRTMGPQDLEPCKDILAGSAFFTSYGLNPDTVIQGMSDALSDGQSELHVAVHNTNVVGFSWVLKRGGFGRSPYLRLLAVDTSVQRSGIGRDLMKALEERHRASRDILLLVTETNHAARRFYEHLGYEKVGLLTRYTRDDANECLYRKIREREDS